MTLLLLHLLCFLSLISSFVARNEQQQLQEEARRANTLFILTNDLDLHMDSLSYMPYLKEHLIDQGLTFNQHYCTVALCCPSRVSMWTGRAARKCVENGSFAAAHELTSLDYIR